MKKLLVSILLCFSGAAVCGVRQGLHDIAQGAVDVVSAPFDGSWDEQEDRDYTEDVRKAEEKRDDAEDKIEQRGSRSSWFGTRQDPQAQYEKDVRRAKEKRDKKREQRKAKEEKEAINERADRREEARRNR